MTDNAIVIPSAEQAQQIALHAVTIVVNSDASLMEAQDYFVEIDTALKNVQADEKAMKKPLREAIDAIGAAAKGWIDLLQGKRRELNDKILAYKEAVRIEAAKEQQKALEKWERKAATTEAKAIANNRPVPIIAPPPVIQGPARTMETSSGAKVTEVTRKDWRILGCDDPERLTAKNAGAIPLDYFILDTSRVGKVIRAGGSIPGVEVVEVKSTVVRR